MSQTWGAVSLFLITFMLAVFLAYVAAPTAVLMLLQHVMSWRDRRKVKAELNRKCVCGDTYEYHNNDDDDLGPCCIIGCYCRRFEEVDPT